VRNNASIVMRIENSVCFKRWFKASQEHAFVKLDVAIQNLRAAKHRFDSWVKPLGRLVLFIDSILSVAARIINERADDDPAVATAKHFFEFVNAETLLQAAMMADAAHETSSIIRTCDSEQFDTAEMSDMLVAWKQRVTFLFFQNGVATTESFTAHMIKFLSKPHVYTIKGKVKSIGSLHGVPQAVYDRCLSRMKTWHRLGLSVLGTEFPTFEIWSAFSIFKLRSTMGVGGDAFERLATAFGVDRAFLKSQYEDHYSLAQVIKNNQGVSTGEAWQLAVAKSARSDQRDRHPTGALSQVGRSDGAIHRIRLTFVAPRLGSCPKATEQPAHTAPLRARDAL